MNVLEAFEGTSSGAPMDQEEADLLRRHDADWHEARRWWEPVRAKAKKARDYYHMLQWTEMQKEALRKDGKPAIVINLLGKAVDNICGRERASRYDWKASPVGQDDILPAAAMTHGLKSIARLTEAKYSFSEAFEDAIIGPMGWIELGYDDSDPEVPPEVCERVDPDEMYLDPHSRRTDTYDAKYAVRRRIVDVEDAIALAPHLEDEIRAAAFANMPEDDDERVIQGDYNNQEQPDTHYGTVSPPRDQGGPGERRRVELREHHWWKREATEYLELPNGLRFYPEEVDQGMLAQLLDAGGDIREGHRRCYYKTIIGAKRVLFNAKSDLPFGRLPFVAIWAKRDREGRPYGLVELGIPPQEEVNVARSRLNESLRSRWLVYGGSGEDLGGKTEQQVAEALARGNFVLKVKDPRNFQLGSDKADIQAWLELMREAKSEIDAVFGNNDSAYGDEDPTAQSGVAKQLQVQQQSLNLGRIFDLYRYSRKQAGQMFLALLQKRTSPEKLTRIIGASLLGNVPPTRLGPNGQPIPAPTPDLSWLGQVVAGPVYQSECDVEIEDQAETGTERRAEMQARIELLGLVPDDLKAALLPDTLRASDWSGAEEMAGKVEARMQAMDQAAAMQQEAQASQQAAQMEQQMAMHQDKLGAQRDLAQMRTPPPPQDPTAPPPPGQPPGGFL